MWIITAILLIAFVASASAFGVLLGMYRNLRDRSDATIARLEEAKEHWKARTKELILEEERLETLRERDQSQIKILNGMVDRRNQRVDYYKRELDKCKLEHSNMTKMLTVAINEVNPLTRKKALRGF